MASAGKGCGGEVLGGAEEKPSLLITENRSSLLIRAAAFPPLLKQSSNAEKCKLAIHRRHPTLINWVSE